MSKIINKRIEYVQKALKEDMDKYPERPLNEFSELVTLIGDQFDDMHNLKRKENNVKL